MGCLLRDLQSCFFIHHLAGKGHCETEKEEDQKDLILAFITVVIAIEPFVGEATATAAGSANVVSIITIVDELAIDVVSIYSINEPKRAPRAIFEMHQTLNFSSGHQNGRRWASFA